MTQPADASRGRDDGAGKPPGPILQLRGVAKSFPGVRALHAIDLDVAPGEVLGIVGENGAGKSTLIKLVSGVFRPDSGEIRWRGRPVDFHSPRDADAAGIATIHQELAYCGRLTVAENLFLGEPWPRRFGAVSWRELLRRSTARLRQFGLDIGSDRFLDELSAAERQEVALTRALSRRSRLLILDEPTASLSAPEVHRLFSHLNRSREAGVALVYISHRLDEILQLTDRVLVLRDGEKVADYATADTTAETIVRDMIGRKLADVFPRVPQDPTGDSDAKHATPLLEVRDLCSGSSFKNVSFELRAGEIVGLAGLVGSGCAAVARTLFGLYEIDSGRILLDGQPWRPTTSYDAVAAGIAYVPEERKRQALVLEHSVGDSISIGFSDLIARHGWIPAAEEASRVAAAITRQQIRATGASQAVGTLSGGNQQKTVLARWLEREPRILLLHEPTCGVDIGAKVEIHRLIAELAARGKAVLLISSDLPEVVGMSHRVLVMHDGSLAAELHGRAMTEENVLLASSGLYEPESGGAG